MFDIKKIRDKLDFINEDSLFEDNIYESDIIELLLEGSPLLDPELGFGNSPAGISLAKYLHNKYKVSDQAVLVPYTHKTSNLDLKRFKRHYDNFTILVGPYGWAAFKPDANSFRHKLNNPNRPTYDPSEDKDIEYIGVFSVQDGDKVYEQELKSTRGGAYGKREKKGAKASISDLLKEVIGFKKIKVYRLMTRDDPEMAELPSEVFSGSRSKNLGASGASVQRHKIDVRQQSKNDSVESLLDNLTDRIATRISEINNQVLNRRYAREEPDFEKHEIFRDAIIKFETNKEDLEDLIDETLKDTSFLSSISSHIKSYKDENPDSNTISDRDIAIRIATKPPVLVAILKTLRIKIYNIGKEAVFN